ncbi:MAG TPA: class D sortase [Thermoanaerobaculia bacterium]
MAAAHVVTGIRAQAQGDRKFPLAIPATSETAPLPALAPSDSPARQALAGEPVGRLQIPRLRLDVVVFEGTSEATLRKGPGHLAGTAWPAAEDAPAGNCVIAGHRDSFFRSLRQARQGDLVLLADASGVRRYRLASSRIVRPDEVSVAGPTDQARLTLITCYPFRWIGAAPLRLVWSAVAEPVEQAAVSSLAVAPPRIPAAPVQSR